MQFCADYREFFFFEGINAVDYILTETKAVEFVSQKVVNPSR